MQLVNSIMSKNTIFHITGGLGKHVLATSVINSYKYTHPNKDIVVSSAYPEIFERNPNVKESLNLGKNQYFYKNYILNKDVEIFAHEPYKQTSHILKQSHLIDTWCDMIGITQTAPPSLHINYREHELARKFMSPHSNRPIIIFQPFGGPINQQQSYCWARDIHPDLAQKIVNRLAVKYNVIHICNEHHPQLNNCTRLQERLSPHILFSLLGLAEKRIVVDSCLQHAANAMGLECIVFWNVTSPDQFGYDTHFNITPDNPINEGHSSSYFFDYEIHGDVVECPYSNYEEIFNIPTIENVIQSLL
jgi:ADP-heptose:LPS heptosyltransferase